MLCFVIIPQAYSILNLHHVPYHFSVAKSVRRAFEPCSLLWCSAACYCVAASSGSSPGCTVSSAWRRATDTVCRLFATFARLCRRAAATAAGRTAQRAAQLRQPVRQCDIDPPPPLSPSPPPVAATTSTAAPRLPWPVLWPGIPQSMEMRPASLYRPLPPRAV